MDKQLSIDGIRLLNKKWHE